jgi:hypothetical protein
MVNFEKEGRTMSRLLKKLNWFVKRRLLPLLPGGTRLRHGAMLIVMVVLLLIMGGTGVFAGDLVSTPAENPLPPDVSVKGLTALPGPVKVPLLTSPSGPVLPGLLTIGLNFEGSQLNVDTTFIPPDTMGAVGPDYIVELINGRFDVYDKTTGNQVDTSSLDGFWTNVVGVTIPNFNDVCSGGTCTVSGKTCATSSDCDRNFTYDPRIVYDPASGRWFAVSLDGTNPANGNNNIYVAVSNTDDPRSIAAGGGGWQGFRFVADTVNQPQFHDYETLAVDADGLYTCTQDFDSGNGGGGTESCYSIPKTDLLQNPPVNTNMTRFEESPAGLPSVNGSIQAALNFGPSNGRTPLMGTNSGNLVRSNIFGSGGAGATLGVVVPIAGDPGHSGPPAARQPTPGPTIENVAPRIVANVVKQGNSLWAVHAVQGTGSNSAIRWYEIDEATNTVLQTGLIENVNEDFHEPSIAVNEFGQVVIGYTCSGPSLAASACASVGETIGGVTTFEAPMILASGGLTAPDQCYYVDYGGGRNRWGDYSATVLDPVRACTFWTLQEFLAVGADCNTVGPASPGGQWGIQVTQLAFSPPVITVPGDVDFPDTCVDGSIAATLNVCNTTPNSGPCANLVVDSITSSDGQFEAVPPTSDFPVVISPDFCFPFQVRFTPTSAGAQTATLTIASNDPTNPSVTVQAAGNGTVGDIRVTGSSDFGDVCAETQAEKTISVCNVGGCNLNVASASFDPACADFTLINNPFPATVSPDSCEDITIRFTPTSAGPKTCSLVITSSDPDTPGTTLQVTANTPIPLIDVSPDVAFPPAVIQSIGACQSQKPFPISNTGTCNLTVTSISVGGDNGGDFSFSGLPSFPVILEPGHIVGEGGLEDVFEPTALDRDRLGTITVTYESDPITHATTSVTRQECGEGVNTGARVLVTAGGIPLDTVEKIQLQRINANRNKNILDTNDVAQNVPLTTVTPAAPCAPFQYHREYGTVSNPVQLLPGSYQVTVMAIVNGKRQKKTVGFSVDTCGFQPTIVIDF